MGFWRNRKTGSAGSGPSGPKGYRAYAVGDVHGRLDLLNALLENIEQDLTGREDRDTYLVFLGDLIDRGPDSRGVIERLRTLTSKRFSPVFLLGNHEEVLLRLLGGERGLLASWMRFGGAECAASYGADAYDLMSLPEEKALDQIRTAIPEAHAQFIASFIDTFRFGDYLFVHAGIRPGVDLAGQSQRDLRWIRTDFLDSHSDHGFLVVHGHTSAAEVVERGNRIGIDTGAYMSGILTAIGLEDRERWYLSTNAKRAVQSASPVD